MISVVWSCLMQESSMWREEGSPDAADFSHEERARRFVIQVSAPVFTGLILHHKNDPIDFFISCTLHSAALNLLVRFWQARAVESFLRGATSYADQMFLLKRGLLEVSDLDVLYMLSIYIAHSYPFMPWNAMLSIFKPFSVSMQHILFCIIDSGCKSRDVLQSYFDLLGELMKFNIDAFKRFNKYVNTEEKVCVVSVSQSASVFSFPLDYISDASVFEGKHLMWSIWNHCRPDNIDS